MKLWLAVSLILVTILTSIPAAPAAAGPNAGGAVILHRNPALVWTSSHGSYCGQSALASCESAVVTAPADPDSLVVFHALAAFPSGASPRLGGLEFGIQYDPERLVLVDQGMCGAFEVADTDWPASGSGTAMIMGSVAAGVLTEVYWFVAYTSEIGDTTSFALGSHSGHGGLFADDSIPAVLDPIAAYGRLGFGTVGVLPCPTCSLEWSVRPNPAAAGADIVFLLESALHVKIGVFDVRGRSVARLLDVTLPQGPQRVRWNGLADDGRAVGGGIYFVRMDAGCKRVTKKLVCLR